MRRQQTGDEHDFTLTDSPWHLDSGFDTALRGYQRRQVDNYVQEVQTAVTELVTRHAHAQQQIRDLTAQVVAVRAELLACEREHVADEQPTAQQLGSRLDRILVAAERQADELTRQAEHARAEARDEAEHVRAEAHEDGGKIRGDAHAEAARILTDARGDAARIHADAADRSEKIIGRAHKRAAALQSRYDEMQQEIRTVLATVDQLAADSAGAATGATAPDPRRRRDDRQSAEEREPENEQRGDKPRRSRRRKKAQPQARQAV